MRIYLDPLVQAFIMNSLFIFGLYAATGKNSLLGFVQRWKLFSETRYFHAGNIIDMPKHILIKRQRINDMIKKPLFNCPPCMASVWGTAGFFFTGIGWGYWIVWVMCLAGFNYIVNKIVDR